MMRTICISILLAFMTSCLLFDDDYFTYDVVARVASPSGHIEAVLAEFQRDRESDFDYEVFLVPTGGKLSDGVKVASLDSANRNKNAYGVNLKWDGAQKLIIEYLNANNETSSKNPVTVAGEQVQVLLRSGVNDPTASSGKMCRTEKCRMF